MSGNRYHLTEDGPLQEKTLRLTQGALGPAAKIKVGGMATLRADLAWFLFRRYDVLDGDRVIQKNTLRHRLGFRIGFSRLW